MAEQQWPEGSEFGGQPGMIQPAPHELTAAEERMVQVHVAPDLSGDSPEIAIRRLNTGERIDYGNTGA